MLSPTICCINAHFTCKPRNHYLVVQTYTHMISTHIHHAPHSHTTSPSRYSPLSITPFISPSHPLPLPHPVPAIRVCRGTHNQRILSHFTILLLPCCVSIPHTTYHVPHTTYHVPRTTYYIPRTTYHICEFTHALTNTHTVFFVKGNVAYNKPSTQSIGDWGGSFPAGLAVDGNTNPSMAGGHCAHPDTDWGRNAWWMVDLEETYNISRVIIFNRDAESGKNNVMAQRKRTCICTRNVLFV